MHAPRKKSYLIDFSFKFNGIKFVNLLMNWFIWEKMFTYCYNKFRPVNRMHSVNSLLLNSGCCWKSVAPWITILSQHTLLTILSALQIHFCVIFCETRHHAQAYVKLGALVDCGLSLATRWTKTAREFHGFRWPVLVIMALEPHSICCCRTWSSNQTGGGVILAFSSFFNQIPHQKKSEISVGILSPTWR